MILISHRGNLRGPNPEKENHPSYIREALDLGFDVEVDVWWDGGYILGHDKPQYEVAHHFFHNRKLWCHAKNIDALYYLLNDNCHCFWHESDNYTLTSQGIIWAYPGQPINCGVNVLTEKIKNYGTIFNENFVCSDYVLDIREKYNELFNK